MYIYQFTKFPRISVPGFGTNLRTNWELEPQRGTLEYVYAYRERERERERDTYSTPQA